MTYVDSKTPFAINQSKLINEITKIAEQKLQDGLSGLPQNLNVDTKYEVKETGLLQTDIKVVSDYITGSKRWYIIDFIDEKTRITYCYPSEQAQTRDIVNATKNALNFYQKLGIKIKRIRTDNGSQYTNTSCGKPQRNRWFTNFCNKKGIVHETTPFRSPQSNGKIERFHRNWSNLFEIKPYLNSDFSLFQKLVNSFQEYYNNSKPHKSLGLMTPMDYFDKLLLEWKIVQNVCTTLQEMQLFNELSRENKLKKFLNKNKIFLKDNYDYIIIDTNPSLNITNINAYLAADNIVLVSDNSIHSLRAIDVIGNMWETITKNLEIPNNIKAIVLNNFDHFNISKDFKDELEKLPLKELLIKQDIRKKQVFKTSEITGVPVIKLLAKQDNPYFHIVTELEQKGVV